MSEERKAIPETVTPDGLRGRAELMRAAHYESCARHLELAADEIASLRAQLEGCQEMFAHVAERANGYVKAFQREEKRADKIGREVDDLRAKLESARKALEAAREEIVIGISFLNRDAYTDRINITATDIVERLAKADGCIRAALTDETGK